MTALTVPALKEKVEKLQGRIDKLVAVNLSQMQLIHSLIDYFKIVDENMDTVRNSLAKVISDSEKFVQKIKKDTYEESSEDSRPTAGGTG